MKTLGDSHWIERGNSLKNNNIFLRIKQFVQKNKCNLCKKTIFLCKIAVALRMDWVQRVFGAFILSSAFSVALRMDWVQRVYYNLKHIRNLKASHSVWIGFSEYPDGEEMSHSVWSAWI